MSSNTWFIYFLAFNGGLQTALHGGWWTVAGSCIAVVNIIFVNRDIERIRQEAA